MTAPTPVADRVKKTFHRKAEKDRSQMVRLGLQSAFLLLNLWIGIEFYLWVRGLETGRTLVAERPAGVEGWLPIAGLMNTKYLLMTGRLPAVHPAALFLFLAFVGMSLVLKRAFCSWLCPVGTFSEVLWKLGRSIFRANPRVPRWLDLALRSLKYILLVFFAIFILTMSAAALDEFMGSSYGLMVDVRMMNFFRYMSLSAALVIGGLVLGSIFIRNLWCRYLCPYGALLGLVSLVSPVKIRRDTEACVDCGKCAKSCPAALPVDKLVQVRSAECTACFECIAACSTEYALNFAFIPRKAERPAGRWRGRVLQPLAVAALVVYLFAASVLMARITGHWKMGLSNEVYQQLIPNVNALAHPGM